MSQGRHLRGGDGKSPGTDGSRGGFGRLAYDARGAVDGKVDARLQNQAAIIAMIATIDSASMPAVADEASLRFVAYQLGSGAAGDQGMKSADGAAGNGDKCEGKDGSGETGPVPSAKRVSGGMFSDGRRPTMPMASRELCRV
jgi:hypothetical protein